MNETTASRENTRLPTHHGAAKDGPPCRLCVSVSVYHVSSQALFPSQTLTELRSQFGLGLRNGVTFVSGCDPAPSLTGMCQHTKGSSFQPRKGNV